MEMEAPFDGLLHNIKTKNKETKKEKKKKKLVSSPSMRKQYFVAMNFLGEWGPFK